MAMKMMKTFKYNNKARGLKQVEIPIPTPSKGEILLKVEATSLNIVDFKAYMLKVLLNPILPKKFPMVPSTDVAGEVVEIGPGVTSCKPGDNVVALTSNMGGGGLAEYAVAMEIYTVPRPTEVSAAEASGLPIEGLTAYGALTHHAGLKLDKSCPQKNILVTAASGGVGHYAVQLAKLGNIHVTATCGARNIDLVKSLGADEVLDYKTEDGAVLKSPSGRKYDVVIHTAATRVPWAVFSKNLSENGVVIDISPGGADFWTFIKQKVTFSKKKLKPMFAAITKEDLKVLVDLVKEGKLKTIIQYSCGLDEAGDAWAKMLDGHATGKLVIEQSSKSKFT